MEIARLHSFISPGRGDFIEKARLNQTGGLAKGLRFGKEEGGSNVQFSRHLRKPGKRNAASFF